LSAVCRSLTLSSPSPALLTQFAFKCDPQVINISYYSAVCPLAVIYSQDTGEWNISTCLVGEFSDGREADVWWVNLVMGVKPTFGG